LWSFTIVTTSACKPFAWLHDRQPVILSSREALDTWLDTSSQAWTSALTKLVEPCDRLASSLECYQVPKEVGKVGTESPTFIEPIANRKDGIQAMFSRQMQAQSSPMKTQKRRRSTSPSTSIEQRALVETGVLTPKKAKGRAKQDDHDDIFCLDNPTIKTQESPNKSRSPVRTLKIPSKVKNTSKSKEGTSSSQITQFFSKT